MVLSEESLDSRRYSADEEDSENQPLKVVPYDLSVSSY